MRVDTFLASHLRNYTSWRLQRFVLAGAVWIDQRRASPNCRVYTGQIVEVSLIEPPDDPLPAERAEVPLVHEEEDYLVINKPAGMIVHPCGDAPRGTLINYLQAYLDQQTPVRGLLRPGVVHRLDRETSGLLVVAKTYTAHRSLSLQFQRSRVSKVYTALVEGRLVQDEGCIDWPIGRVPGCSSALMSCRGDALDPRPASTQFQVLQRFPQHTLVKVIPRTGRLHQIRVHLAAIGHPVVGDEYYAAHGQLKPPRPARDACGFRPAPAISPWISRHALHATELSFAHPQTSEWMTFRAPLPEDIHQAIRLVSQLDQK